MSNKKNINQSKNLNCISYISELLFWHMKICNIKCNYEIL